ncbi:hypothetical protein [Phenylobacterium sp.]|uniref:hypothetical protein n=1 Tax=Phenylobacterium sp. TaxID=1871053 RepID=UPI002869F1CD|nr:hypothetical protein [Phenylobacterium sp.]
MTRLGDTGYFAQGGDWGTGVVQATGRQAPSGRLGIHTNRPATIPGDVGPALGGGPLPPGLSPEERATVDQLKAFGQFIDRPKLTRRSQRAQGRGSSRWE